MLQTIPALYSKVVCRASGADALDQLSLAPPFLCIALTRNVGP